MRFDEIRRDSGAVTAKCKMMRVMIREIFKYKNSNFLSGIQHVQQRVEDVYLAYFF